MFITRVWIAIVTFVYHFSLCEQSTFSQEQRLFTSLFQNYSVESRPVLQASDPVIIYITTDIVKIDAVNEKTQAMTLKVHVKHEWKNSLLTWDPEEYGGVDKIVVPVSKIWTPFIHLYNHALQVYSEKFQPDESYMVLLDYRGNCTRFFSHFFISSCDIKVNSFPFDEHICLMEFGSWTYDESLLQVIPTHSNAVSEEYVINGEWELLSALITGLRKKYRIQTLYHSSIQIRVHIQRKHLFFVMNLVIPCALIASMIFLVFLLPPKSGERISLGITVLLSMAIFQELSSEKLPTSSENFPLLGVYYTISMFEIGIAMAMNCFILNLYYRNYDMPHWVRSLVLGHLAKVVRVDVPLRYITEIFVEVDCPSEQSKGRLSASNMSSEQPSDDPSFRIKSSGNDSFCLSNSKASYKSKKKKMSYVKKDMGEDWRMVARIVDRLMLFLSVVIGVVSAVTIFLQTDRFKKFLYG
ncbi:neuronal acetylcholine receptor subunit alpha-3 isoform X1 [Hydra vulgaris]|uniref:neuronal acetylcholine receptor subunit alpha-3 isoform X1 n=1 Tax=Hydra vulgaris TaxID=6087 RepID=UPI001F5F198E|nr:neuronal acetylcholine receptor subunit alpha-3 [Hydra vulgaris]